MHATQAVFDNRYTMSYSNASNAAFAHSQFSSTSSRFSSNGFSSSSSYGGYGNYTQPRSVSSHYERDVVRTPAGSMVRTSMTTVRQSPNPYDRYNDRCHVPPPASRCPQPKPSNWSNTEVKDNKGSVDLGKYALDFNKKDSSMTMRDKASGDATKIWGDPHLSMHGKDVGLFNGPMTFNMNDGTKVTVGTAKGGNASTTYADNVTITKGNQAYQVTGLSEKSGSPLTIQRSNDGRRLDAQTPDGYSLVENRNGPGWVDPKTGKEPTRTDLKNV
ncbi:MAG TPA: DUF1521 domain-containing protein [Paraburkholderia sp.]|jgi:hypothetical protein|nr:DUF1521 domain-containing protein [Paraburkholderia sp.]